MAFIQPTAPPEAVIERTKSWLNAVVIGLNLCPFAAPVARSSRLLGYHVSESTDTKQLDNEFLALLDRLQSTPAHELETLLFVVPNQLHSFDDYLATLDAFEYLLERSGLVGEIQIASFHPRYQFDGLPKDDITHWTNRSPYPIFHLLREASLEKAIAAYGDAHLIPERNIAYFRELQQTGLETVFPPFAEYAREQD